MGKEESYSGSWDRPEGVKGKMDIALKEWSERWLHIAEGGEISDEGEYMQWYQKITRKYIVRVTSSLESEYQRTVCLLLVIIIYLSVEHVINT